MKLKNILPFAITTAILYSGGMAAPVHAQTDQQPVTISVGGMSRIVTDYYEDHLSETGISIANVTTFVMIDGKLLPSIARTTPFDDLVFSNTDDFVNIRSSWSSDSEHVGKLYRGHAATVINKGAYWTKVKSGNVTGYIANKYLLFGEEGAAKFTDSLTKYIEVTCQTLNVRSDESTNASIVCQIGLGEQYKVVDMTREWFKITGNSFTGYVHKDYADLIYKYPKAISIEEERQQLAQQSQAASRPSDTNNITASPGSGSKGQSIATYAMQFVGNPYVWGGTSLTKGADCSGFVYAVYQKYGYSLPRTSKEQARNAGIAITPSLSVLKAGDLLFYGNENGIVNHVAMYAGNGRVVHASNQKDGIKTNTWNYRTPLYARRIIY